MKSSEVRRLAAGRNQRGLRDHNERLILSTIQRHGALPGSDIARRAGLSPQTVSVILRALEQDGLLLRGEPQRGRVGKPWVPMALAPDGVYTLGLKIGRRSADLVLADFLGQALQQIQITYRYPRPAAILDFVESGLSQVTKDLSDTARDRIAGIGIAQPYEIWNWHDVLGAPAADLAAWKTFNFVAEIGRFSAMPVFIENDATAACLAEHVYGRGREFQNYAYFFVGSFIGGGVVLNHSVFKGTQGNAGAFGSLAVRRPDGSEGQLIDSASLYLLEADMARAGIDPQRIWTQPPDWSSFPDVLSGWIERTATQLARAALAVCAIIDFEAVLIDGGFPDDVRKRIVARAADAMANLDHRGLIVPQLIAGIVGQNARALGAAATPLTAQLLLDTHREPASS